jgi:hypothetical protein
LTSKHIATNAQLSCGCFHLDQLDHRVAPIERLHLCASARYAWEPMLVVGAIFLAIPELRAAPPLGWKSPTDVASNEDQDARGATQRLQIGILELAAAIRTSSDARSSRSPSVPAARALPRESPAAAASQLSGGGQQIGMESCRDLPQ